MYPNHIVLYNIIQILFVIKAIYCIETESTSHEPHFDRSGWRTLDLETKSKPNNGRGIFEELHKFNNLTNRNKKLVEWDDDGSNDLTAPHEDRDSIVSNKSRKPARSNKWSNRKPSRLIYHGQLTHSDAPRVIDGVKLYINTHEPLKINRRSFNREQPFDTMTQVVSKSISSAKYEDEESEDSPNNTKLHIPATENPFRSQELSSDSDWKPIILTSRSKRMSKTKKSNSDIIDKTKSPNESSEVHSKWKPVSVKPSEINSTVNVSEVTKSKGHKKVPADDVAVIYKTDSIPSSIEQPFDDDGIIIAGLNGHHKEEALQQTPAVKKQRESKFVAERDHSWKPLDATSTPSTSLQANISNESAQRSASDINYIYSPQQTSGLSGQPEWSVNGRQAPNGYYQNYVMQPQQQNPDQQSNLPIVDSVSGQVPEMVGTRSPDNYNGDSYSLPQTSASFQPIQPAQTSRSYGEMTNTNIYSYSPPARQQQPTTPAPVVRQEHHHHHYYNQQAERQTFQPQTQSNVIRELQPLLISSPFLSLTTSSTTSTTTTTTPAPVQQIIREVIKEVPMQPMQLQPVQLPRFMVAQPTPLFQPTRELEPPTMSYSYPPSQQMIRQISNNIPTVAIRMPQIPQILSQIRVPLPTIQLQAKIAGSNSAPVTRQTGSFIIPPVPQKTTTYLTETQAMPTHTTIMHTTQFTPATRTTVYTTEHQSPQTMSATSAAYKKKR